jgi:hypothetical protein
MAIFGSGTAALYFFFGIVDGAGASGRPASETKYFPWPEQTAPAIGPLSPCTLRPGERDELE